MLRHVQTWLFEDIYDGRGGFGPKESLKQLTPDKLGAGDVLLAECYLTRYRCDGEGKPVYTRVLETRPWTQWRTGFEMKYLTLLRTGEDEIVAEPMPKVDDSHTARM